MKADDSTPEHIANPAHVGYLKAVHVNLKALMEVAYDLPDLRMYGGPAWTTTERWSVEAKAEPEVDERLAALPLEEAKQAKRRMLASLLADRFQLRVRTEVREMPIYALVVAKGGPRLDENGAGATSAAGGSGRITEEAGGTTLAFLCYELSWRLGRPVIDRTGLPYRGKLTLSWQEEEDATAGASGPSLFTALQEQLGLKLESTRGPVPGLVIEHAERPPES